MFLNLTFGARASILGITPAVGRQKATSLPTVSSDRESHFSTTGCTQRSGSVATAGQLEPVDVKLSANTSCSRAQAPLHCLNVLSSSSAWLGKNVDLSCYSERMPCLTSGCPGTNTEGNPARAPMVVTLIEVENNTILSHPFVILGDFLI